MSYTDEALATILDAKADQLRDDKHAEAVALELATLLGDVDGISITETDEPGGVDSALGDETDARGLALFVPADLAAMRCDGCGGETQTYVHTDGGLALCPDCAK